MAVLLLSLATVTPSPQSGDHPVEDECNYSKDYNYKCGDKCLSSSSSCLCGDVILGYEENPTRHCCPDAPCTHNKRWLKAGDATDVFCEGGKVLDINTPCQGVCYADFEKSKYLDLYKSRFACEEENECLKVTTMCQGQCSAKICRNETLRCDQIGSPRALHFTKERASLKRSEVIKEHSYCKVSSVLSNNIYDIVDRSDEEIENTLTADTTIDYTYLTNCTTPKHNYHGITCYQSSNKTERTPLCRYLEYWCRSDRKGRCVVNADGQEISTTDKIVCGNNTFWRNVQTSFYSRTKKGEFHGYGKRCNGTSQHQINPWYLYYDGKPPSYLKKNCEDFSDQIHTTGAPCPNRTHFLKIHRNLWCSDTSDSITKNKVICADPSSWKPAAYLLDDLDDLDDPHFCQQSCDDPGPGCIACTNKDYFQCENSSLCIHPRLKCDGHPQCPDHDDEDYKMCRETYIEKRYVAPFASYRCHSKIYPEIEIIATRCNNVKECDGDEDEKDCSENPYTKHILVGAIFLSLCIFLGMKLPQVIHFLKNNKKIENEETEEDKDHFDKLLQILKENPENTVASQNLSIFLLYIQNTKKTSVVKKTFVKFYDSLVVIFEYDLAQIFSFLKAHIQHEVTTDVVQHRFCGIKTKVIQYTEKKVIRQKMITQYSDKVTETPLLRLALSSLDCLVGLLSHILDLVKDSVLALTLLHIIGIGAIIEFSTSFSAAVVLSWMGTIFIPILLSSVHLAIKEPFLVFNSARLRASGLGRVLASLGCLVISPLNTVVLKIQLDMKRQEAINSARVQSEKTLDLYKECNIIEDKILAYLQHKIGNQKFLLS